MQKNLKSKLLIVAINDLAVRLGITSKSLHTWIKCYGEESSQHQTIVEKQAEVR